MPNKSKSQMEQQLERGQAQAKQMTDHAMTNYENAMRTGMKFQEEAGRWWSNMMTQTAALPDWQRRWTGLTEAANRMMPVAQERMQEAMDLIEKNGRANTELMRKALDAAQTLTPAESQKKWMDWWIASLGAARTQFELLTEYNTRAIDSMISLVRKNTEPVEVRMPKAA